MSDVLTYSGFLSSFHFPFRNEFLSPELVAAASAVAESLPFDKQTTKSDLLRQLQQHEEESRAQKAREKSKIRSVVRCHVCYA